MSYACAPLGHHSLRFRIRREGVAVQARVLGLRKDGALYQVEGVLSALCIHKSQRTAQQLGQWPAAILAFFAAQLEQAKPATAWNCEQRS